ncbi:hypothetical protein LCGC14_3132210, partial [marine sediment metagenome]
MEIILLYIKGEIIIYLTDFIPEFKIIKESLDY